MSATDDKKIWDFLKGKGLNEYAVAGVMGNLYAESGLRANNLQNTYEKSLGMTDEQYTASVDNGSYTNFVKDKAGYGLAQWTYWSRKQALLDFCKATKTSIGDLTMQLNFLWKELQGYKSVMSVLNAAASIKQASNAVLLDFERPANQGESVQNKRAEYGKVYYDKYAKKEVSGKMNLNKLILVNNDCYKANKFINVKGIMVHSTGANNPTLKRYVGPDDGKLGKNANNNHWNQAEPGGRQVCVHAFIGKLADGSIATYQTLPWNMRGWHGGSGPKGSVNDTHIGFEICEDGLTDATYFNKAYNEAVELCAYLCKEFNLNPLADGVIIGHYEGNARGIASNHGDPKNWFPKHGKSMDTFRAAVKSAMGGTTTTPVTPTPTPTGQMYRVRKTWADAKSQIGAYKELANAKACVDKYPGYSVFDVNGVNLYASNTTTSAVPFLVKVAIPDLNIREGPGTNYAKTGHFTGIGSFTIVEESAGVGATKWGKLKSGAGWISLDFVKKL